jgi:hypothetical protein
MEQTKGNIVSKFLYWWFWISTCYGFVCDEFLSTDLCNTVEQLMLLSSNAAFLILGLITIRHKLDIAIAISYVIISFICTCIINHLSPITWLNGSRIFWGFIFTVPIFRFICDDEMLRDNFVRKFDRTLLIWLYVQAFCITWQYFEYGAGDPGGGSFGTKGFSGTVSICIYLISLYLIRKRLDNQNLWRSVAANWKYLALLIPTFMNETKISFILLALYLILLIPINKKTAKRLMIGIPAIVGILAGAVLLFSSLTMYNGNFTADDVFSINFLEKYMYADFEESEGNAKYGLETENQLPDVPRITKIAFLPILLDQEGGNPLFGFGVGHFMTGSFFGTTELYENWDWLLVGTSPMIFLVFVQLGILGCIWTTFVWITWFTSHPKPFDKRDINIQLLIIAIIVGMLIYGPLFRDMNFCYILIAILYFSWERKDTKQLNTDTPKANLSTTA